MSYIGNRPLIGNFVKLDSIASQFNGSTVAFTLKVGGSNTTPGSAQNLIIAVGGVIQEPAVAYNISASTITFTSAPATNATFWGVQLGDVLTIGTPSNGTVGLSQLSATGTPSTTTFHRGDNSWSQIGVSAISATGTPSSTTFLRGDNTWAAAGTGTVTSITAGTGLSGGTITTSGTIALVTTAGAVGTYVIAIPTTTTSYTFGSTLAGSSLTPYTARLGTSPASISPANGSALSGTWQCMSLTSFGSVGCSSANSFALWIRTA